MEQLSNQEIEHVSGGMLWRRGEMSDNVFFQTKNGVRYEPFGNILIPVNGPNFNFSL